jgi:hypothetical protein
MLAHNFRYHNARDAGDICAKDQARTQAMLEVENRIKRTTRSLPYRYPLDTGELLNDDHQDQLRRLIADEMYMTVLCRQLDDKNHTKVKLVTTNGQHR